MRPALALLALLLPAAADGETHAATPSCADAVRMAWPEDPAFAERIARKPDACAIRPWPAAGPNTYVIATGEVTALYVALLRVPPGGAPPHLVAQGSADALTIDQIWTPSIDIAAQSPLGPGVSAIAVRLTNSYVSTARRTETTALHLFLRQGDRLDPVFSGLLSAEHRAYRRCGRPMGEYCDSGWSRTYTIAAEAPARDATPPRLVVRDARTRRVLLRPRWRGTEYDPPVFDRMPVL